MIIFYGLLGAALAFLAARYVLLPLIGWLGPFSAELRGLFHLANVRLSARPSLQFFGRVDVCLD
jgi:hypothetical protein